MLYPHLRFTNTFMAAGSELDFSEKLPKALLNTVLGMGIVFAVLIFISILIYLMKFIPNLLQVFSREKRLADTSGVTAVQEDIANEVGKVYQEENLITDTELVAVITAAIMAYMGDEAPADGLVVRTIKRAKQNRWQRAES